VSRAADLTRRGLLKAGAVGAAAAALPEAAQARRQRRSTPGRRADVVVVAAGLADLAFDGQTAIAQRGLHGRGCHYVGNAAFVPSEDQAQFRRYAGDKPDFLAIAPWVVGDRSRARLRAIGSELAPGSGSPLEDDYVETGIVADLPVPVDRRRPDCVISTRARGHSPGGSRR